MGLEGGKLKITEISNGLLLENLEDFDAKHIFECGQCFRWNKEEDGSYTGVAFGRVLNVKSDFENKKVWILNTNLEDFKRIWFDYFDLGRDYQYIKDVLSTDTIMKEAIEHGKGIRILRQDPWETLISYIISANNRISMISRSVDLLSENFGGSIKYDGKIYFSFPSVDEIFGAEVCDLEKSKAGFRCKYIKKAIDMVKCSEINLNSIAKMDTDQARKELMKIPGVGPKVADCILLFSMQKYETYPVDVWVKRVTEHFYLGEDTKMKDIHNFAREKFGVLAGFAQEYLFYYARGLKL